MKRKRVLGETVLLSHWPHKTAKIQRGNLKPDELKQKYM